MAMITYTVSAQIAGTCCLMQVEQTRDSLCDSSHSHVPGYIQTTQVDTETLSRFPKQHITDGPRTRWGCDPSEEARSPRAPPASAIEHAPGRNSKPTEPNVETATINTN